MNASRLKDMSKSDHLGFAISTTIGTVALIVASFVYGDILALGLAPLLVGLGLIWGGGLTAIVRYANQTREVDTRWVFIGGIALFSSLSGIYYLVSEHGFSVVLFSFSVGVLIPSLYGIYLAIANNK